MVSDFGVLALLLPSNPIQDHQSSILLVAEELSASGWLHARHPLALGLKPVATEVPEAREKSCVARRDRDGLCPSFLQLVTNHCVHDLQILNCPSPWSGPPSAAAGLRRAPVLTFCAPQDRPLQHINKKGRPVSQCQHCRSMRKSRASHVKCDCGEKSHKCIHLKTTVEGHKGELRPRSGWLAGLG